MLYIGTSGSGLVLYNPEEEAFAQYYTDNSALISNNIYTILPKPDGDLLLSTENGIVHFSPRRMSFNNWTREQGLMSVCFNPGAGILHSSGRFILGSNDGVIGFPSDMHIPVPTFSPMLLSDLNISYQTVYPGDEESPLETDINDTKVLKLKYEQNTFSLRASSINYDYPSNILYSWRLEGFYDEWTTPSSNGLMRFTNIPSGKYMLHVRSVSNEEKYKSYEQRSMLIIISPPLWATPWAIAGYIMLAVLVCVILFRIITLRKQKRISEEKTRFFINTAHDIRTPLTLIKAPLEELRNKDMVNEEGKGHVSMALRNVDVLLRLITNLINFERINTYSSHMYIAEYELGTYISGICDTFHAYANIKHIRLTYDSNFQYLNVWFDRDKMDSIMKNILSNAMKYTPENGNIYVSASEYEDGWGIEVKDTGIGIPRNEQKGLFHTYFRGSNAVNLRVSGSGIGLALVHRLVRLHGGKITIESTAEQGTLVRIIFPKGNKHFRKASIISATPERSISMQEVVIPALSAVEPKQSDASSRRILIVEDNDDLRIYLVNTLGEDYLVQSCHNGKEALEILSEFKPDLVLSDIMMPEMDGLSLCRKIKQNTNVNHVPVILLTAKSKPEDTMEGMATGADAYMVKPFNTELLKSTIANLLANRKLLKSKFSGAQQQEDKVQKLSMKSADEILMSKIMKVINENLSNPDLNVEMLAANVGLSRVHVHRKLKELTNLSARDFIKNIRLQQAAALLKEKKLTVSEVAYATGYTNLSHFSSSFKEVHGMSPKEYMLAHQG